MRFPWKVFMNIPRNLCSSTRAIGVLFIKMFNSEGLICLRRGWKMMNLDLSGWTVSLFALNQEETWESSWLTILVKVAKSLWRRKILVSTAKRMNERKFEERKRSLMYKRNNKGPRTEPWGTPHTTVLLEETWLFPMFPTVPHKNFAAHRFKF